MRPFLNLPNQLTFLRIVLAFIFMGLILTQSLLSHVFALFIYIIAMLTDLFDGWIARNKKLVTNLGKLLDPLADKILVTTAFVSFVQLGLVPAWMVVLILTREFGVTGLRLIASSKGKIISASLAGKQKTVSQMVMILLIIFSLMISDLLKIYSPHYLYIYEIRADQIILIGMIITVIFTLISGYTYVKNNLSLFEE